MAVMKFLFHFYDLHRRAGIQRAICELSNALVEEGHEVVLAADTPRLRVVYALDDRVFVEQTTNPEPQIAGMAAWPRKTAWALRQIGILQELVQRQRPSVVVNHGTALGLIYPFPLLGGVPFVLQRHFPVRAFPNGRLLYRLLSVISGAKTVVVLTEGIAAEMRSHGYRDVTVIPNLVPAEAQPTPFHEATPCTGLLMGRAGNPIKGFDLFLKALALRRIEGWHFRIVGPGVDSDRVLLDLVYRHRLEDQVELLPASADPYQLIRSSSCLIMPSRYEALPMVALEALSIGRPILASDVDGLREIIIPGLNGILFPAGNVAKLSASLAYMHDNAERLEYFANNASATVNRFRRPVVLREWCALVTRLADRAHKKMHLTPSVPLGH